MLHWILCQVTFIVNFVLNSYNFLLKVLTYDMADLPLFAGRHDVSDECQDPCPYNQLVAPWSKLGINLKVWSLDPVARLLPGKACSLVWCLHSSVPRVGSL